MWVKYESDKRLIQQRDKELLAKRVRPDDDFLLSQPDDIHPDDVEIPDEPQNPETADGEFTDSEELAAAQADRP